MNDTSMREELDGARGGTLENETYDDETIIWEGGPSQWINLGSYLWWLSIVVGTLGLLVFWNTGLKIGYDPVVNTVVEYTSYCVLFVSLICVLHTYLSTYYEHTIVTANKIAEAKGISIFGQVLFCEISDITDIKSPPVGLLGLLGLSTLIIETKDDDQQVILIRAIRDREKLIETLQPIWRKLKHDRKGYFGN